ncbi:tyrosine-type recombinase/integrase [Microbacterium allomyrinae]|uniref:Tyrosine-type recombinase/integrase family protein n=1 Tax=Microbacterium allomyrinae TaxID=2830666 RepID=A0A9X1LVR8_9MICO|nr:site-specific integrase [Microbacterium allomyrinae]MCC2032601.1 tyrosine-type recombinase/integrase family protein [Microbacterium allomyrinae]
MPKAREHGQGALYWVETRKMWRAVVDVGFDPETGARLQKARMSKTKDGAVKKLNLMLRERDSLGMVLDRSTRVDDLAKEWLDDISRRAKPHTLANYRSIVRTKILPTLGRRLVVELTPADVRRMHAAIRKTGVGDSTVAGAHRTLVTMLEHARAERISTENVAMLTPPRRARPGKARDSLTRDEAKALLAIEDARWTLGLLTGLRSGEARALRREDVDLARGIAELSWSLTDASFIHGCGGTCGKKRAGNCPRRVIEISDDLEWQLLEGRHVLVRPKNDIPREIPLTEATRLQLQKVFEGDDAPNPHGLVWHRADGSPKTNTDDNDDLRAALLRAGVAQGDATTHWLRHSYVTLSEHAGIPWAASAGVSGHGSPEASDPYRHVLTAEGRRAVERLAAWVDSRDQEATGDSD